MADSVNPFEFAFPPTGMGRQFPCGCHRIVGCEDCRTNYRNERGDLVIHICALNDFTGVWVSAQ